MCVKVKSSVSFVSDRIEKRQVLNCQSCLNFEFSYHTARIKWTLSLSSLLPYQFVIQGAACNLRFTTQQLYSHHISSAIHSLSFLDFRSLIVLPALLLPEYTMASQFSSSSGTVSASVLPDGPRTESVCLDVPPLQVVETPLQPLEDSVRVKKSIEKRRADLAAIIRDEETTKTPKIEHVEPEVRHIILDTHLHLGFFNNERRQTAGSQRSTTTSRTCLVKSCCTGATSWPVTSSSSAISSRAVQLSTSTPAASVGCGARGPSRAVS